MIQHVIEEGNLALLVTNDWEFQIAPGDLVDILDPSSVAFDRVGGQPDQLDATLGEFGFQFCESAKLGGAHRGIVFWVREEDDPVVTNKLVEVNWTLGGLGLEIGGNAAEAQPG